MTEQNKLIAEFMEMWYDTPMGRSPNTYRRFDATYIVTTPENLEYHTSWDWLIPVVEKINNYDKENGDTYFLEWSGASDRGEPNFLHVLDLKITESISTVYVAVIQFIEWYNLTTLNKDK